MKKQIKLIILKFLDYVGIDIVKIMLDKNAINAINEYNNKNQAMKNIELSFYAGGGGNFGDWLNIFIYSTIFEMRVNYKSLYANSYKNIGIGSVINKANENTKVYGAGINNKYDKVNEKSTIIGVRGPHTYNKLSEQQKNNVKFICDPGFFIYKLMEYKNIELNTQIGKNECIFIPHLNHNKIFIKSEAKWNKYSVSVKTESEIKNLLAIIKNAELIVTSAMHVAIAGAAANKKIIFLREDNANRIPGDGIKYDDAFNPSIGSIKTIKFSGNIVEIDKDDAEYVNIDRDYIDSQFKIYVNEIINAN
jgi:pyruvyltransferase